MEILLIALLLGLIPAVIAHSKGRSLFGWWIYGFLLFIVALPHAILASRNVGGLERRALGSGEMKKCPFCAEWIKMEAKVCRFCGRDLSIEPKTAEPKTAPRPPPPGKARYIQHEGHTYHIPPNISDGEAQEYLGGRQHQAPKPSQAKRFPINALATVIIFGGVCIAILSVYGFMDGLYRASRDGADISEVPVQAESRANISEAPVKAESGDKYWVTSDRLSRRTCPSTTCGIVGQLFYREAATVYEQTSGWARISNYYDASCVGGESAYVDDGDNTCSPENGIVDGKFAEWVAVASLSKDRPSDPALGAQGTEALVAQSDDYRIHEAAFVRAAESLISSGRCSEADFREMGGWVKSMDHRVRPIYFMYCGGLTLANRLYLDAETGEIFR